jgi:hypothetical protein
MRVGVDSGAGVLWRIALRSPDPLLLNLTNAVRVVVCNRKCRYSTVASFGYCGEFVFNVVSH